MSYSGYASAAGTYREHEVLTASPAKLVVLVYDHVLANLRRAQLAHEAGNIEARFEATSRARDGITELLATLDIERGADIASQLRSLYGFMLTTLVDVWRHGDAPRRINRIINMVSELREAFATIAAESAAAPAA
jgi:flagellar protein FliS